MPGSLNVVLSAGPVSITQPVRFMYHGMTRSVSFPRRRVGRGIPSNRCIGLQRGLQRLTAQPMESSSNRNQTVKSMQLNRRIGSKRPQIILDRMSFHNFRGSVDMASQDSELVAVCSFLNELSLDEIIQYGPDEVGMAIFKAESIWSSDDDDVNVEASVTGTTSDEDLGSDSESQTDATSSPKKRKRRQKSEAARERQRLYDKKCRFKRKTRGQTYREMFISVLNELIRLMHFRLLRTENEVNLLCLAKKNGLVNPAGETALHQLKLNHGAIKSIDETAKNWHMQKNGESGKCFLKHETQEIQGLLNTLLGLRDQLNVATDELRWRLEAKTTGVWV